MKLRYRLADRLSKGSGFEHTILTGNGTTAIWALLNAYSFKGKLIAIADNTCFSVLMAVLFSGNEPYYLDIRTDTGCIDSNKLKSVSNPDIAAVIFPYMYGQNADISDAARICKKKNWILIEDYAQAFGIPPMNKCASSDAAILSFGAGKIIEAGHGGAVKVKTANLKKRIDKILSSDRLLSRAPVNLKPTLSQTYKFFYNNAKQEEFRNFTKVFYELFKAYRRDCLIRFDEKYLKKIWQELDSYEENLEHRLKLAGKLKSLFSGFLGIKCMEFEIGSIPWRFNIFVRNTARDMLLKQMLFRNFLISSWYAPLSYMYPSIQSNLPKRESSHFGDTILNLWVNKQVGHDYCVKSASFIKKSISRINGADKRNG